LADRAGFAAFPSLLPLPPLTPAPLSLLPPLPPASSPPRALTPPHFLPDWHVGVRVSKSQRLVACITGVPASLEVHGRPVRICEINYLCVDKKLRSKRLAPVLIKEVTRRVNLCGIWQAAYTAGVVLPRPVASCKYWHRSLDVKKLVEVGFSRQEPRVTLQRSQLRMKLPEAPATGGIRPLCAADVPSATVALNSYLSKFALRPLLSEEELGHWLLPRQSIVDAFVVTKRVSREAARREMQAAVAAMEARRAQWRADFPGGGGSSSSGAGSDSSLPAGAAAAPSPDWACIIEHACAGLAGEAEVEVVTDLVSFYHLPSTVIGHAKHSTLYAAYLYYLVADVQVPMRTLLADCLVLARDRGIDVVNCLNLMDNAPHLEALKFAVGDGNLQYYLFNWACPQMEPSSLGLVLH
jgi:glycylpeptide N-tetradecanoyltransferase